MSKYYIVWNEDKTEGFATVDQQLAYEVRKAAEDNCYDKDGNFSDVGSTFCNKYYSENCTIEEVE